MYQLPWYFVCVDFFKFRGKEIYKTSNDEGEKKHLCFTAFVKTWVVQMDDAQSKTIHHLTSDLYSIVQSDTHGIIIGILHKVTSNKLVVTQFLYQASDHMRHLHVTN